MRRISRERKTPSTRVSITKEMSRFELTEERDHRLHRHTKSRAEFVTRLLARLAYHSVGLADAGASPTNSPNLGSSDVI